ncbi:hypothetical protein CANARDRAFT_22765 [[Candida] arabinofermentans NRRL YB-2248]|uniref:ribonuclease H n=1 Tax=[Candida] arabinofermentans NRRL YB-2248 TaxID=983967 RepID=A0A1E4T2M3_9ASCO|nr:hypothetical protein CANARDRAFT_22765 [[Candida] arabinofermentans NRRL YB-2248]
MPYYAIRVGGESSVCTTWDECRSIVRENSGARYEKFKCIDDAYRHAALGPKFNYSTFCPTTEPITKTIYTDGSLKINQHTGNITAGYGVFFGKDDPRNISKPLYGDYLTSTEAEYTAILAALECLNNLDDFDFKYEIMTDSQCAINGLTFWFKKWERNGWKNNKREKVSCKDLILNILHEIGKINQAYHKKGWWPIDIMKVKAHSGDFGNGMADKLACLGAEYSGLSTEENHICDEQVTPAQETITEEVCTSSTEENSSIQSVIAALPKFLSRLIIVIRYSVNSIFAHLRGFQIHLE